MHDVFLSYGHLERVDAEVVRHSLTRLGLTVWMDEVSAVQTGGSVAPVAAIGIPAGQFHEQVIWRAIEDAAAFVVVDGSGWRESDYCRRELAHAREIGKRLAVVTCSSLASLSELGDALPFGCDDLASMVNVLSGDRELAYAHSRLLAYRRVGDGRQSLVERLSLSRQPVVDAEALLSSEGASRGDVSAYLPTLSPVLRSFAVDLVARAHVRRRKVQTTLAGAVTAFALLLVVAVCFGILAQADRTRARRAASRAQSLELSSRALLSTDGPSAVSMARRALAAESNPESRSAMSVTSARMQMRRDYRIPAHYYASGTTSVDGTRVVLGYVTGLVLLDGSGETLADLRLRASIGASPLVLGPGRQIYALPIEGPGRGKVVAIDPRDGSATVIPETADVSTIVGDPAGAVWWGSDDGTIGRVHQDGLSGVPLVRAPGRVIALEATRSALTVVTDDWITLRYQLPMGAHSMPVWRTDLRTVATPEPATFGPEAVSAFRTRVPLQPPPHVDSQDDRGAVLTCGRLTHVLLRRPLGNLVEDVHVEFDSLGRLQQAPLGYDRIRGMACGPGDDAYGVNAIGGYVRSMPANGWSPSGVLPGSERTAFSVLAASPGGGRAAVAQNNGRLEYIGVAPAVQRTVGSAIAAVPVGPGLTLVELLDGDLYLVTRRASSARVGHLTDPLLRSTGALGPAAGYGFSTHCLYRFTKSGVAARWPFRSRIISVTPALDARALVVVTSDGKATLLTMSDGGRRVLWTYSEGHAPDFPEHAVLNGRTLWVSTFLGRLLVVDMSTGKQFDLPQVAPVQERQLVARPGGGVVAAGADGVIRAYDGSYRLVAVRRLAKAVERLDASPAGLLLAYGDRTVTVLSLGSLEIQRMATLASSAHVFFDTAGRGVATFEQFERWKDDGTPVGLDVLRTQAMEGKPRMVPGAQLGDEMARLTFLFS